MTRSTGFQKAWDMSQDLNQQPSNDEKLALYAYGKLADKEEPKKPGTFDLQGKYKYNKFQEFKTAGVTPQQAEAKYIETVNNLKKKYGLKAGSKFK